jgi:hypothetical protein
MNIYAKIVLVLIVIASYAGTYYKGRVDEESAQIKIQRDGLLAYAEQIKEGVIQHDKDQIVINRLHDDLSRVSIHIPTNSCQSTDEASRVFSIGVDNLFADLQERTSRLVQEADQLNADTIRLNNSLP